jgi:hypothetical protein
MKMRFSNIGLVLAAFFLLPLVVSLEGLLRSEIIQDPSLFRVLAGGVVLFFIPGLLIADLLRVRLMTIPELVAKSFVFSVAAAVLLCVPFFFFKGSIQAWSLALWTLCMTGTLRLIYMLAAGRSPHILSFISQKKIICSFGKTRLEWAAMVIILAFTMMVAHWGEDLFDIGGEKLLHLMFVRQYFSMPLDVNSVGIAPGMSIPNIINLYEFLLAAWARLGGIDPLFVFDVARGLNPLIGLSALFVFIWNIFFSKREAHLVFFVAAMICLGGLFIIEPSNMSWVHSSDPTRYVTALMGSAHHADSAMAILLPLGLMTGLLILRRPTWEHGCLWIAVLVITFLWHPRHFAQTGLYIGFAGLMIPLAGKYWKTAAMRWGLAMGLTLVVAALLMLLSVNTRLSGAMAYDEALIKQKAREYALCRESLTTIGNPMHVPLHFSITSSAKMGWIIPFEDVHNYFKWDEKKSFWLYLWAVALVIVVIFGGKDGRSLAFYTSCFHILVLCWMSGMLFIQGITYSEFFISTPRLIYIFALVVVSSAIVTVFSRLIGTGSLTRTMGVALGMSGIAIGIGLWRDHGMPFFSMVTTLLGAAVFAVPLIAFLMYFRDNAHTDGIHKPLTLLLCSLAFCGCLLWPMYYEHLGKHVTFQHQNNWFQKDNPAGLSTEMLQTLRTIPHGRSILADYRKPEAIASIYAPLYPVISPVRTVIIHREMHRIFQERKNPVFHSDFTTTQGIDALFSWLDEKKVDFILFTGRDFDSHVAHFMREGQNHSFLLHSENKEAREVLFQYNPGVAPRYLYPLYQEQIISESVFPISMPADPVRSEKLKGNTANSYGWINVGWRGEILVSGVEDDPDVIRLVAGLPGKEYDGRDGHTLLLKPIEAHGEGLSINPQAQFIRFEVKARTENSDSPGSVHLRLDAMTSTGWKYNVKAHRAEFGKEWVTVHLIADIKEQYTAISPIIVWTPDGAGDVLELRNPRVNFQAMVKNDQYEDK